jgi:hypothetical protein
MSVTNGKILCYLLLFFLPAVCMAQLDNQPENLPKYDKRPLHFGFSLGINSADFVINRAGNFKMSDTIYTVESEAVSGLNLGILANLRISDNFDFRFIPTLLFGQRNLHYHFIYNDTTESIITKNVESTYLEFPFLLKFKSARRNNYRVYVLAGFKYGIDMVSQAKVKAKEKDVIKLNKHDYGYEVGVGFDFYLAYFKFSPEIKMFNGVTNLLLREKTQYVAPIDALYSKTFIISFLFE